MIDDEAVPSVVVGSMEMVHREEIDIINTLLRQIDEASDLETLTDTFDALLEHMRSHFASEEKLMKESRFSQYRLHKSEHDKILNEARNVYMDWRSRKETQRLKEYLEEDIAQWLVQHIKAMDIPMAQFLVDGVVRCSIR